MFDETVGGVGVSSISVSIFFTIVMIWCSKVESEAGESFDENCSESLENVMEKSIKFLMAKNSFENVNRGWNFEEKFLAYKTF